MHNKELNFPSIPASSTVGTRATETPEDLLAPSHREFLHYLIQIEEYPEIRRTAREKVSEIFQRMNECQASQESGIVAEIAASLCSDLDSILSQQGPKPIGLRHRITASRERYKQHHTFCGKENLDTEKAVESLRLISPTLLMQPCWLQQIGQANFGHCVESSYLFGILSRSIGSSTKAGQFRKQIYHVLQGKNPGITESGFWASIARSELPDWTLAPGAIYLSLAHCVPLFLPEILGFTFAYCVFPASFLFSPVLDCLQANNLLFGDFSKISSETETENTVNAIKHQLNKDSAANNILLSRIKSGLLLYVLIHRNLNSKVIDRLQHQQSNTEKVIELFRSKAKVAAGHHRKKKLGDRMLDDWFRSAEFDGEEFLEEMLKAGYFDRQDPKNSRFFQTLTSFNGPMFGVFSETELATIIEWLHHPNRTALEPELEHTTVSFKQPVQPSKHSGPKLNNRQLYFQLLNMDHYPSVLPAARRNIKNILARANRWSFPMSGYPLGKGPYRSETFNSIIQSMYQREMEKYSNFHPPPKLSKEAYEWGILQFAPTILVDGCWLQDIAGVNRWDCPISQNLFKIFADEIGNGFSRRNHANVYRKLLASLDIQLPHFSSEAFSQNACFLDGAFEIPAFLLGISHFPKKYFPEILGLNLAIEISGLGASYQRLVDELNYWKIDPEIISLHISIDNFASGHSAIAKNSVMDYMDQVQTREGYQSAQIHWKRIVSGYLSLNRVARRFKFELMQIYVTRFLIPGLYRSTQPFRHRIWPNSRTLQQ